MPWCPSCKYEYEEGVRDCPDCRIPLVEELPLPKPKEKRELWPIEHDPPVGVLTVYSEQEAAMVEALFRSEGIPTAKIYPGAGSYLKAYMGNPITPVELTVPQSYEEQARALLEERESTPQDELLDGARELQSEESFRRRRKTAGIVLLALLAPALLVAALAALGFLWAGIKSFMGI